MFFMNAKALEQLVNASGFEVGVGPSVVLVDEGMAKTTTTNTMKDDIYAFVFGQKGLMAGLGIQGNKITKITPKYSATRYAGSCRGSAQDGDRRTHETVVVGIMAAASWRRWRARPSPRPGQSGQR